MSVVRGTSLSGYPRLVAELGGDPGRLLRAAGIRAQDVGDYDVFIPFRGVLQAIESAADATATPDFGRRLAAQQSIEIFGPVGVAARTAATVADALTIFSTFMAAYSPAIGVRITATADPGRSFFVFELLVQRAPPCPQSIELSLGVALRVLRFLLGSDYAPLSVHFPHDPLTRKGDYVAYFGCRPYFAEPAAGFTIRTTDLRRPLHRDDVAHRAIVEYLNSITAPDTGLTQSVRTIVRQLLPTGAACLEVVAAQFALHPKALQRRLGRGHNVRRRARRGPQGSRRALPAQHAAESVASEPGTGLRRTKRADPVVSTLVRLRPCRLPQGGAIGPPR